MHSTTHTDASVPIRNGGMLARLSDVVAIAGGALLTARAPGISDGAGYDSALVAFSMLLALMLFPSWGMYRLARRRLFWRCVCLPVLAWFFVLSASCAVVMVLHRTYRPATDWLKEWAFISSVGVVLSRVAAHAVYLRLARQDARTATVAVVGNANNCRQLMRKVGATQDSMFRVTAAFDTNPRVHSVPLGLPTFCDREAFAAYVRNAHIDELWLAVPLSEGQTIVPFVELFRNDLINIRFIPDVTGLSVFNAGMANLEGTSAINLMASPIASTSLIGKEIFDRIFALCALFALAPLLFAITVAVKCSSQGPVFFAQRRKGANGKIFNIYKFAACACIQKRRARSSRQHAMTRV